MNLDEQLRAALNQEAEMQTPTRPDIEGLISGGQVRRRRRNIARIGVAAAAALLVGGGAYAVTQIDGGDADSEKQIVNQPSENDTIPEEYRDTDGDPLEPGTYRKLVGFDASAERIEADLTFEGEGWSSGNHPTISEGPEGNESSTAGATVYQMSELPRGNACMGDGPGGQLVQARETPKALAQQLARLPQSTLVQPVTQTEAFGLDAFHLRLRIDDDCPATGEAYLVAETAVGGHGISFGTGPEEVVIDFLVVDLDGTPVVVEMWHQADASSDLVDRATRVRDSITFVTPE